MANANRHSQTISVGRIVHYTLPDGQNEGEVRPAIVVRVWGNDYLGLQLQVFTDEQNDGLAGVTWRTSVEKSNTGDPEPGRWHWPKIA